MWNRYKILTLPVLILISALVLVFKGEDTNIPVHHMNRQSPFPIDPGTKTELHIEIPIAKVTKSFSTSFIPPVTSEIKRSFSASFIVKEKATFYSEIYKFTCRDRAPPLFS